MIDANRLIGIEQLPTLLGKRNNCLDSELSLPLWIHLFDSGFLMGQIWEKRVSRQEKKLFFSITKSEEVSRNLFILAGLTHDFGKATAAFQARIFENSELPKPEGIQFSKITSGCDHALSGMLILEHLGFAKSFASLAGTHHGKFQKSNASFMQYSADTGEIYCAGEQEKWEKIWKTLSRVMLNITGFSSPEQVPEITPELLTIIEGYLSEADWLVSNANYFPLLDTGSKITVEDLEKRWQTGWEKIGFPDKIQVTEAGSDEQQVFESKFGFKPNDFQSEVIRIVKDINDPGLVILEAPMGLGKTEAALFAAEIAAEKAGTSGVFFGLPTQATSNGLLPRFENWVRKSTDSPATFALTHGNALLNKEYNALPQSLNSPSFDPSEDKLITHTWLQQSRLNLFSDYAIGTIDTALMAALNHRYVCFRHAGLAGKTVILDEIHSYDSYMSVYLEELLKWLGMYRLPVILLSATLPSSKRKSLIEAYLSGRRSGLAGCQLKQFSLSEKLDSRYPSIICTDGEQIVQNRKLISCNSKKIKLKRAEYTDLHDEEQTILNLLCQKQISEGCTGIIVNSVRKAQQIGSFLKNTLLQTEIMILHSRMTQTEREKMEKQLLNRVGKNGKSETRKNIIVVGTQVLEQSLDIDFDYMISELAPIDLLLQRAGRLHRHDRSDRPICFQDAELVILDMEGEFDSVSQVVYSRLILHRSRNSLNRETLQIPSDIPALISEVYDGIDELDISDPEVLNYKLEDDKVRSIARSYLLEVPVIRRRNLGLCRRSPSIPDYQRAEASVRLTEPSIEVILVKKEGDTLVSPDSIPFSWNGSDSVDENAVSMELLSRRIRIPTKRCPALADELKKQSHINSFPKIPQKLTSFPLLVLDETGKTTVGGINFSYIPELGLKIDIQS